MLTLQFSPQGRHIILEFTVQFHMPYIPMHVENTLLKLIGLFLIYKTIRKRNKISRCHFSSQSKLQSKGIYSSWVSMELKTNSNAGLEFGKRFTGQKLQCFQFGNLMKGLKYVYKKGKVQHKFQDFVFCLDCWVCCSGCGCLKQLFYAVFIGC